MKTGDLVSYDKSIWKQNPVTKKRLGKKPCKVFKDIGIILAKRSDDSYDVLFAGNAIVLGVWSKELEVLSESR